MAATPESARLLLGTTLWDSPVICSIRMVSQPSGKGVRTLCQKAPGTRTNPRNSDLIPSITVFGPETLIAYLGLNLVLEGVLFFLKS